VLDRSTLAYATGDMRPASIEATPEANPAGVNLGKIS
jgi:hypothetical protein